MATTREKSPREIRVIPFDLSAQMSTNATLSSVQAYASRQVTETTTLAAELVAEATSVVLAANPGVGALLVVSPSDPALEETFKVSAVAGVTEFTCDILPPAERTHSIGATVNYERGVNAPLLVDETPTPGTTSVTVSAQQGADAQIYRVSVLGTCNNGERVEDEIDLTVVEFAPTSTVTKQPTEIKDVAVQFSAWTEFFSTTLVSAIAFVAREYTTTTSVVGNHSAGATSLRLLASPGVGALLVVGTAPTQEKLLVSSIGAPDFTCVVSPLQFDHADLQAVTVSPGVTSRLLTSATATISGTEAIVRTRHGAAGQSYLLVVLGTLGDGQVCQKSIRITVTEE